MMKCRIIDKVMANTRTMFFHKGRVRRDSDDDRAFIALSISITTRMESEIVDAVVEVSSTNIEQPMPGKLVEQRWKWV
jgi:hypothetical protein